MKPNYVHRYYGISDCLQGPFRWLSPRECLPRRARRATLWPIPIPSPELQGQLVEPSPTSGVPATSNSGKPVVVSGLIPYTDYVDRVELPQSPPDSAPVRLQSSPRAEIDHRDPRRRRALHSVRGALVNAENAPVANMPGDLVDANGAIIPFSGTFTDEKGVFECYGLSPGPVAIRWGDGSVLSFQVPETGRTPWSTWASLRPYPAQSEAINENIHASKHVFRRLSSRPSCRRPSSLYATKQNSSINLANPVSETTDSLAPSYSPNGTTQATGTVTSTMALSPPTTAPTVSSSPLRTQASRESQFTA